MIQITWSSLNLIRYMACRDGILHCHIYLLTEMEHLKPPPELDFSNEDNTSLSEKWCQWRQTMELYIDLSMVRKSEKDKCGAFLYVISQKRHNVYNAINLDELQCDKINVLFKKFEEYCKPKQNITVERYHFNI